MDASHHLMLEGRRRVGGPSRADGIKVPKGEEQAVNGGEIMYRCGGAKMYHGHRR